MKFRSSDTIAAPATVPGSGAISIVRISGPDTFPVLDRLIRFKESNASSSGGYRIKYGEIIDSSNILDEVLVNLFRAPHSYTGEDMAEICTHASGYIISRLLELLLQSGVRSAEPGEFTRRAFMNGRMDLAQAEAVADVIAAESEAAHRVAMNQMRGGFSSELMQMRSELLEMTSLMELELDFSEEDVEFADRSRLRNLLAHLDGHLERLIASFRLGNAIRNGVPVAIVGPVNAGKSTLLNALLEDDRAIVSDIAGTTRDTIEETLNIDGVLFRFIDTAGLRETSESIEKSGIERSLRKLSEASVVLVVLDATSPADVLETELNQIVKKINPSAQQVLVLLNKSDKSGWNKNVTDINNYVSRIGLNAVVLEISAKDKIGIDVLKRELVSNWKVNNKSSDQTLVTNIRHLEALRNARTSLLRVREGLDQQRPSDLIAQDLRDAVESLGSILGQSITPDEVLGNIFKNFCIGK